MQGRVSLLLDGLEVVNKYTENFLDHGLAGRATPSHLPPKTHTPRWASPDCHGPGWPSVHR